MIFCPLAKKIAFTATILDSIISDRILKTGDNSGKG